MVIRMSSASAAATHPYCGQLSAVKPISSARYQPVAPVMIASVGIKEQRARRRSQEHGLARLNIDHPQDGAEYETHEQIDPGPQQAADRLRCAQLGREALADATITLEGAGAGVPARSVASNIWSSLPAIGARPTNSTPTRAVPFL